MPDAEGTTYTGIFGVYTSGKNGTLVLTPWPDSTPIKPKLKGKYRAS